MNSSTYCRIWSLAVALVVTAFLAVVSVQGQTCGTVGTNAQSALTVSRGHNFYLNTQDPAPCSGTVEEFRFCYYRSNTRASRYDFTFAVYRETSPGSGSYRSVSEAFTTGRNFDRTLSFRCSTFSLPSEIEIRAGDVIGACIYDPPDRGRRFRDLRAQADVVGESSNMTRFLMRTGNAGCGDSTVPDPVASLSREEYLVLHVFASIAPLLTTTPPTTTMGTPPVSISAPLSTTTPSTTTMGTPPVSISTSPSTTLTPSTTTMRTPPTDSTSTNPSSTIPTIENISPAIPDTTDNRQVTTLPSSQPQSSTDNSGVIAAVLVILLLLIVIVVVTTVTAVIVIKKRRMSKRSVGTVRTDPANFQNGMDNAMYSANEGAFSSDYQEIDSTVLLNRATTLMKSDYHYEVEHTYEFTGTTNSTEVSYYAEVGPIQEVRPSPLDTPAISYRELLERNKEEDIYGSVNAYEVPAAHENEIYAQLKTWNVHYVHRNEVEIVGHLGSGQFGSVEQGVWKRQGTRPVDVALKSLNKTSEEYKVKFLQEAAIMAQFRHPNVIVLYGMIASGNPMMLVAELAKRGDLRNLLLSTRPDPGELIPNGTSSMLLKFSQQVALGMQYLSAKGFVHRDLAARNVLVTNDNICKVADFGMSRDLASENYYVSRGGRIPVKWTAPEAIHYKKYSTSSDVWSYGCLLYEIWSVGHKPFESYKNTQVIQYIDTGERLPPPSGTPRTVYETMINCWHPETSQRPSFRDILLTLVGSEEMVLNIPEEDSSTNPLAGVLGAPLEAGKNMYSELQRRYI